MNQTVTSCSPQHWSGYDGETCGSCTALVNVQNYGGSCSSFCSAQGLSCVDAWDDEISEKCSYSSDRRGCGYVWTGTTDAICQCSSGKIFDNIITLYCI